MALEALSWLAVAALTLRGRPFASAKRLAEWPLRRPPFDEAVSARLADEVRWAVLAAARRAPWRTACFPRGLAAQIMLRRRGVPARLYYGARSDDSAGLAAHVWVRAGGRMVVGGEGAEDFAVLAVFPPDD